MAQNHHVLAMAMSTLDKVLDDSGEVRTNSFQYEYILNVTK